MYDLGRLMPPLPLLRRQENGGAKSGAAPQAPCPNELLPTISDCIGMGTRPFRRHIRSEDEMR